MTKSKKITTEDYKPYLIDEDYESDLLDACLLSLDVDKFIRYYYL